MIEHIKNTEIKKGTVVVHKSQPDEKLRVVSDPYIKDGVEYVDVGLISSVDEKTGEYTVKNRFPISELIIIKNPA